MTDGAFLDDGAFHPLGTWDADTVRKLFRDRPLARLIEQHAMSEELARKLLAWRHPGLRTIGDAIPFEDEKAIEDVARLGRQESALVEGSSSFGAPD